jgi:hypothetical protein
MEMTDAQYKSLVKLVKKCAGQLANGHDHVYLTVPGKPSGERKRLLGRHGPLGDVCSWTENGTVAVYKASEILAWLKKHGIIVYHPRIHGEDS